MNINEQFAAVVMIGLMLGASASYAERAPRSLGADARVRQVTFSPIDVIRIDTHLRVNTAIELGRGERISQVLLGDSESYEIEVLSNRNTVSVKPVVARASSNMTIYTNRRTLSFLLTEGRTKTHTFRVVIEYPEEKSAPRVVATGARDTGYQFAGEAPFRPLRVWNDGRHTYFEMPRDVRPSVFGINGAGFETTVNSTTSGSIIKVSGLQSEYSVRIGERVVCIRRVAGGSPGDPAVVSVLSSKEF
jgi:type IV secretion system protein VirB9